MKEFAAKPMLSLPEALKESTGNVFRFTGRARRSEYWWTMLVVTGGCRYQFSKT